jgi:hypothetical protein
MNGNSTHIHDTHVPMEEPSTASKAGKRVRSGKAIIGNQRYFATDRSVAELLLTGQ